MKVRLTKMTISNALLTFSLGCFASAFALSFNENRATHCATIELVEPVKDVGELRSGQSLTLDILVKNTTYSAITVLGATGSCGPKCCTSNENLPMRIECLRQRRFRYD